MGFFFSAILCGSGAIITFECGFCFLAHDIFSDPSPLRAGYLMPLPPGLQVAVFGNCKCSCKMDHLTTSLFIHLGREAFPALLEKSLLLLRLMLL